MKRPEKKKHHALLYIDSDSLTPSLKEGRTVKDWVKFGYNQACNEWERFLPDKKEILKIINWSINALVPKAEDLPKFIAEVIDRRLQGNHKGGS